MSSGYEVRAIAAPDGATASAAVGAPLNKTYTGVFSGGSAIIVVPDADLISSSNVPVNVTVSDASNSDTASIYTNVLGSEPVTPPVITGTVALSHDGNGVTTITATISQNAPIEIYWRIAGAATFNAHSSSVDDNSTNTHSVTINATHGLTIEAYATDPINDSYTTGVQSISVPESEVTSAASFADGQLFGVWALANGVVGGPSNVRTSAMITATKSGAIDTVRQYFIFTSAASSGYHEGTGGIIRVDIVTDNGGLPSTTVVATGQVTPDLQGPGKIAINVLVPMTTINNIVAGQKYHFVYTNIDPNPYDNWLSVDGMWGQNGYTTHWASTPKDGPYTYSVEGGPWVASQHQHIYQINYTNGEYEGFGIFGGFGLTTQIDISGANQVQQVMEFDVENVIQDMSVRMGRKAGNDPITLTIRDSSDTVIATDSVLASVVPVQFGTAPSEHDWIRFDGIQFTALDTETYTATLSTPGTSVYHAHPMQKGSAYGFGVETFGWGSNIARLSTNSGSTWAGWTYNGNTNRQDAELSIGVNADYATS